MAPPLFDPVRARLDSWFARRKSQLVDDPLEPLPRERSLALQRRIAALDVPTPLRTFVGERLTEALAAWRSDREAANVMIVLSRPVEPMAPVIEAVLTDWDGRSTPCQALLPCRHRPQDPAAIPRMLTTALEEPLPPAGSEGKAALLSLANLDQCFLRCIDGWSGIERLRQVALEHRDRFWLLGCNSWAWKFLDHVSQISSYFPDATTLPPLDGPALAEWLAPVAADLGLSRPGAPAAGGPGSGDPAVPDAEADQWGQLAELAAGSSRIAAELWLEALRLAPDSDAGAVCLQRPALPDLPTLTDEDRYLLHSLLIHGTMRRDHLAFGLGLPSHRLQPRIHWLLGEGLIETAAGELSVRPSHFPCLVKELTDNNFFTGEA
ncbi:hypothetical protein [Synechococcus sp. CBW1107]|uniref:hypothetical protein n=1 Tax=Synechococcus sp. CBW1107 TaxID=2789857 RepID=UPI002AD2FE37|nr:hypothetical protein [Synechococcus sp. CBW1107]CAK6689789.1 hypothetical protein ICNINCKA_00677 [Synechococcus sp. CBW1107]